jgi:hypothetical protein
MHNHQVVGARHQVPASCVALPKIANAIGHQTGLILVTPFDSLEALARDLYWWAPVGLLLRHRMPTIDFMRGSPVPTALVVAERDSIVPARRSMALRPAIANLVFEGAIDAGHDDLYGHPAFAAAMREALARVEVSGQAFGR